MTTTTIQYDLHYDAIATHGIAEVDRNGYYTYVNEAYIRMLDLKISPESITGKYIYDLPPKAISREKFINILSDGMASYSNTTHFSLDINGTRLSVDVSPVKTGDAAEGAVILVSDLTEDTNHSRTERLMRDMYRSICEDQSEIIIRILATGHIVFTNDAACRFFGLSKHDMYGSFIGKRHLSRLRQLLKSDPGSLQKSIIYHNENSRYIDYSARLTYDEKGEPFIFTFVGRDVTDHVEAMASLARLFYSMVTNKEREVIDCLMKNMTRKEIAHVLDITTNSYDTLIARIKKRWGTADINSIINIISKYHIHNITTDLW